LHPFALQTDLNAMAQKAGAKLRDLGANEELGQLRVEYEVRTGKPFVEIIVARRVWQADLIVVGGPSARSSFFVVLKTRLSVDGALYACGSLLRVPGQPWSP
jgi:nucleotide-binding universal stress UspA family protein